MTDYQLLRMRDKVKYLDKVKMSLRLKMIRARIAQDGRFIMYYADSRRDTARSRAQRMAT